MKNQAKITKCPGESVKQTESFNNIKIKGRVTRYVCLKYQVLPESKFSCQLCFLRNGTSKEVHY